MGERGGEGLVVERGLFERGPLLEDKDGVVILLSVFDEVKLICGGFENSSGTEVLESGDKVVDDLSVVGNGWILTFHEDLDHVIRIDGDSRERSRNKFGSVVPGRDGR